MAEPFAVISRFIRLWVWGALFSLTVLALSGGSTMFGQAASGTGSISGLVTDPSSAAVPDADITIRNVGTNASRAVKTSDGGLYEVDALQPGDYEIKVSKMGFATIVRSGLTVSVGQQAVVNLAMQVSQTSENGCGNWRRRRGRHGEDGCQHGGQLERHDESTHERAALGQFRTLDAGHLQRRRFRPA